MATTVTRTADWSLAPAGPQATAAHQTIKWLLLLNLLDGLFTMVFLQLRVAEELNPLMRAAWDGSPLSFMALKLGLVQLGVWVLWLHQELRIVRFALLGAVGLYAGVVVYHLSFLAGLALR